MISHLVSTRIWNLTKLCCLFIELHVIQFNGVFCMWSIVPIPALEDWSWRTLLDLHCLFCHQRFFLLHRHHAEQRHNPCNEKIFVDAKTFENTAPESGCFWSWSWLTCPTFAIELLVKWVQRNNPSCTTYTCFTIILTLFSYASFFSVMIISADRFLAIHLHLRYKQLVAYKRVVSAAISIWILSAFLSLVLLWIPNNISFVIAAVIEVAICLASTTFFNYNIYLAVRRHTNQIQALQLQIQEEQGHGENAANSASLQKSALGAFYVYLLFLLCYLPNICSYIFITIYGSGTTMEGFFVCTLTLVFVNSSLNPLIYCWKMRHVRHAIMEILRKILTLKERCCWIQSNSSSW